VPFDLPTDDAALATCARRRGPSRAADDLDRILAAAVAEEEPDEAVARSERSG